MKVGEEKCKHCGEDPYKGNEGKRLADQIADDRDKAGVYDIEPVGNWPWERRWPWWKWPIMFGLVALSVGGAGCIPFCISDCYRDYIKTIEHHGLKCKSCGATRYTDPLVEGKCAVCGARQRPISKFPHAVFAVMTIGILACLVGIGFWIAWIFCR